MSKLKLAIYGDSLSTGTHGEGGYIHLLRDSLNLDCIMNYSIGSSTLSLGREDSMVRLIDKGKIPDYVDIILIWHGTNDWYWGHPLGKLGDTTGETYYGAISYVVEKLRKVHPITKIIWVTPIFRREKPFACDEIGNAHRLKNRKGKTLHEYSKALQESSEVWGFPVIDMHRYCGIHDHNVEIFLEDQVHPNKKGYKVIHKILDQEIRKLL